MNARPVVWQIQSFGEAGANELRHYGVAVPAGARAMLTIADGAAIRRSFHASSKEAHAALDALVPVTNEGDLFLQLPVRVLS